MDPNEKIQLDDITFDDVITGDGVETEAVSEIDTPVKEEVKEETPEAEAPELPELDEEEDEKDIEDDGDEETFAQDEVEDDVEEDEDKSDQTVVLEVLDKLGYELGDAEYEDTPEGLADMTADIASQMADDRIDEVLENFPLVKQHLEYVLSGGDSKQFMSANDPNLDYNNFNLEEQDTRAQKAILQEYFNVKGHDKEFSDELIEDYEDSGKLFKKAEQAKNALGDLQGKQREQLVAKQQQTKKQKAEELSNFWEGVNDTIENSKEFVGITVPQREKEKFFRYLSTPVNKQGHSQRDIDHSEADMDVRLAIDYLMFKGFNLDKIIDTKARTKSTKSLRDKISSNASNVKSAKRSSRRSKNVNFDDLDLSI